jgi:hypothetical protein
MTWEERASVSRYIDRPCLAVDGTTGPNRGRLYVHATVEEPITLVSKDAAKTFSASSALKPPIRSTRPSHPVVLPDGPVLVTCANFKSGSDPHLELPLWRSVDGGKSFGRVTSNLAGRWKHRRIKSPSVFNVFYPALAVDSGNRFPGRLYCVWREGHVRAYILFASSRDGGATWSTPVILSEQPAGTDEAADFDSDIPAIAVNKVGIVAVSWYDRRGLPKDVVGPNGVVTPGKGYNARLRISPDGGVTWSPSVQLNSVPMKGELLDARYWTGLVAAADGRFQAAWIGDATGKRQVWTASVHVAGSD